MFSSVAGYLSCEQYISELMSVSIHLFLSTVGPDKGGYYHEMFLRGKQFLTKHIKRSKVKGTGPRKSVPPELVPDLYAFPPIASASAPRSMPRNAQYPSPALQQSSPTLAMLAGISQPVGFQQLQAVPGSIAPLDSTSSFPFVAS